MPLRVDMHHQIHMLLKANMVLQAEDKHPRHIRLQLCSLLIIHPLIIPPMLAIGVVMQAVGVNVSLMVDRLTWAPRLSQAIDAKVALELLVSLFLLSILILPKLATLQCRYAATALCKCLSRSVYTQFLHL